MENEVVVIEQKNELSDNAFNDTVSFQKLYDIGKMFASSTLVPQAYQGKPMDCTIAVDMANRMNVSPMIVMQNLYVVKGKPSWSGQACMSLVKANPEFKDVRHVYTGQKGTDTWGCYVTATRTSTDEVVNGPEVTIKMAKAEGWTSKNPKWTNMPELMLAYRAAAFFARVHIPNALMGCSVEGEAEDTMKVVKREVPDVFGGDIIDAE